MSLLESHPLAVGLLLFGFAYLNSRASTARAPHRGSASGASDAATGTHCAP